MTSIPSSQAVPDAQMDLRGIACPLNFVRTKLRLDRLQPGQCLAVWLDGGEPVEQVPASLRLGGYVILSLEAQGDYFVLKTCRPEPST
ncbi:MAG: sulfurtransferase TusA family protein [Synechococcales cyanobacterium RM1_1_8]|nr:sulfurtransferase TusA family protein [Synechococcales cyanobacterium RM1_1_8]